MAHRRAGAGAAVAERPARLAGSRAPTRRRSRRRSSRPPARSSRVAGTVDRAIAGGVDVEHGDARIGRVGRRTRSRHRPTGAIETLRSGRLPGADRRQRRRTRRRRAGRAPARCSAGSRCPTRSPPLRTGRPASVGVLLSSLGSTSVSGVWPIQVRSDARRARGRTERRSYGLRDRRREVRSRPRAAVALPPASKPTETQLAVYGATGVAIVCGGSQVPLVAGRMRVTKLGSCRRTRRTPTARRRPSSIARCAEAARARRRSVVSGVAVVWERRRRVGGPRPRRSRS